MDPLVPLGLRGVFLIFSHVQAWLQHVTPVKAYKESVSVVGKAWPERGGSIEGAIAVERCVLEWCFDLQSERRLCRSVRPCGSLAFMTTLDRGQRTIRTTSDDVFYW